VQRQARHQGGRRGGDAFPRKNFAPPGKICWR